MCVSRIAVRWILFSAGPFTISCCISLPLIGSGSRLAMFSVRSPFSMMINVLRSVEYSRCFCCRLLFLLPFTVVSGCRNCFPFARLLLTVGVFSFMLVPLVAPPLFLLVLFIGSLLLMLHLSACFAWCFPKPFPWTHLSCIFRFGRLRPGPPIDREFCCICVNTRLKGGSEAYYC